MSNNTITGHLKELKNRLLKSLIAFCICSSICYLFKDNILHIMLLPLNHINHEYDLNFFALQEAFLLYIRISMIFGFMISFPIISYQIYSFIAPALYKNEKYTFLLFLFMSQILFTIGIMIAYYFILPYAYDFFTSFANDQVTLHPRFLDYVDLFVLINIVFGIIMQLPLVLILLNKIGFITSEFLSSKRKIFIIFSFVLSAFITPPDIFSQIILALIMIVLYEFSILYITINTKRKKNTC